MTIKNPLEIAARELLSAIKDAENDAWVEHGPYQRILNAAEEVEALVTKNDLIEGHDDIVSAEYENGDDEEGLERKA